MGSIPCWRTLDIAIIGGGIGGLAAAISLRRAGHQVTIYERSDFVGEVGASISCAANGTRWLEEWKVDLAQGDGVILQKLINRDWNTGEPVSVYDLADYKERWGYVSGLSWHPSRHLISRQYYYMFHRQDMHAMLKACAMGEEGEGYPLRLVLNHKVSTSPICCIPWANAFSVLQY
jgi:salicylate hydroxylase